MRTARPTVAMVGVLLGAGCAAPTPLPSASGTATTSSQVRCRAGQLVLTTGNWGGAGGTNYINLRIAPARGEPCVMPAAPALLITDGTGIVIASAPQQPDGDVAVLGVLHTMLGWGSSCGPIPPRPYRLALVFDDPPVSVTTDLPGGFFSSLCMGAQGGAFLNQPFGEG
jgi:hypothetical protein